MARIRPENSLLHTTIWIVARSQYVIPAEGIKGIKRELWPAEAWAVVYKDKLKQTLRTRTYTRRVSDRNKKEYRNPSDL